MISKIRNAFTQPTKRVLSLNENQIIQGKITKIYPDHKAEIQLGNHKLIAEIRTSLSVGRHYFFQVQEADHVLLKVLGEQSGKNAHSKMNLEKLLGHLGLKVTKSNSVFARQLIQEKIPFNQAQLSQAFPLLETAQDKAEATHILKEMIAQKLPITDSVYQALKMNRQESISNLMNQVHTELSQLQNPSVLEKALMKNLESLISRPMSNMHSAVTQQIRSHINGSLSFLNALKAVGMVDMTVSEQRLVPELSSDFSTKDNAQQLTERNKVSMIKTITNSEEAEQLVRVAEELQENSRDIQRTAGRMKATFLTTGELSPKQVTQAKQMMEQELYPLLPKETVQVIQNALQQIDSSQQQTTAERQILRHVFELFSNQSTFEQLTPLATTKIPDDDQLFTQRSLSEQFLTHLRHYLHSIGFNDEYELRMNLDHPNQLKAMSNESQSVKSMLMGLIHQQEHTLGDRAQALLHFINGMQMQTVTEMNHLLQASFTLPGDRLELNQDIFMQFEGKKDENGKIDSDYCRILFVLDLANIKETMLDMHIQKRIISVTIYNEREEPSHLPEIFSVLKDQLEELDYQLSAVKWKPLYERTSFAEFSPGKEDRTDHRNRERYDFFI